MKKFKKILGLMIVIGLICATFQIGLRIFYEQRNTIVEIVADYEDFCKTAVNIKMPFENMAKELRNAGVNSVAILEEKLINMEQEGKILLTSGSELNQLDIKFNNKYNPLALSAKAYLDNNQIPYSNVTLVFGDNNEDYKFLTDSFSKRFKDSTKNIELGNNYCIIIEENIEKIKNKGLGFRNSKFEEVQKLGFTNIVPRIENYEGITKEEVDSLYNQLKKYKVRTVVFAGVTVLGQNYKDKDQEMIKYIGEKFSQKDAEIITAILEKPAETNLETIQRGINSLARESKYVNTKVFSVDSAQLQKLSSKGLTEQWGRAISQRNVRVLYVRPLRKMEKTSEENFENTLTAIRDIKDRVNYMGMEVGNVKGLGNIRQTSALQMLMAIGVISAGFLLLMYLINFSNKFNKGVYALYILTIFTTILIYFIPFIYGKFGDLYNKLIAFSASVIFASLAGAWIIYTYKYDKYFAKKSNVLKGIVLLSTSAFIAIVGGVYIGAILSDSKYILKLDTFRGVKLSFLIPLILWGIMYVCKIGFYKDEKGNALGIKEQIIKFFNEKITVKYAVIVGTAILALGIVLLRSGNTGSMGASSIELTFRNLLEKYLIARPRTKELIAFPILFLIPLFSKFKNKEFGFFAMGIGMLGLENIINSFCHIRMPVFVTSLSTIYSLIFAIIVGSIVVIMIEKLAKK